MFNVAKISFSNKKDCYCKVEQFKLKKNITVIVNTPRGLQFGTVEELLENSKANLKENKIVRIATKQDYHHHMSNITEEKKALNKCKRLSEKHNLNIQILDANFTFDRSQLMFRFISDTRIDFRDLAKDLASFYRTRIELRQIGIRDKAKEIGGIGPCGQRLCCSKFLKDLNSVSINMAKNQGISLNQNKINGCCGRLLCCLNYENEMYSECKKNMPSVGNIIKNESDEGKVISVDLLKGTYKVDYQKKGILEESVHGSTK